MLAKWKPVFEYIPIESQIEKFQNEYYEAIARCHVEGEFTLFIAFMYFQYIPNDTLKWLKNSRLYGSIDEIFEVSFSKLQPRKEPQMGKSLHGKELQKYVAKQINTKVIQEEQKERRVLTVRETELFLKQAELSIYYNLFIVALETGNRIERQKDFRGVRKSGVCYKE